jgi:flavin-dependent dehydrogenase
MPLVEALDVADLFRAAAVSPMTGTVVAWGGPPLETTFQSPGLHVSRRRLDPALRFAAVSAGASLREGGDPPAQIVVDATGRGAGPRATLSAWRTLAVVGDFDGAASDPRTWIESFERGWVWSVPAGAGRRQVTLMIDPAKSRAPLERRFEADLARGAWTARALADAALAEVRAVQIAPSILRTIATARRVAVGDAACAVDPLGSFGLKKALESARKAAAVVHATLTQGGADEARAAYVRSVQTDFAGCMSGAAAEVARAAARHEGPFWSRRTLRKRDLYASE